MAQITIAITQLYDGTRLYGAAGSMTFPVDTWLLDRVAVLRGPERWRDMFRTTV